jgi:acyl-coenzyme A thioesterase PaaI-like protein
MSMTVSTTPHAEAGRDADQGFVVYSHVGVSSTSAAPGTAQGELTLRPDLRGPSGVAATPLLVMALDSVATATAPLASAVPSRVAVEVLDPAQDVHRLRIDGRVRRHGRSQIFYDAQIRADDDSGAGSRLVGYGSVTMAVTGPPVPEYAGHAPSARATADVRPRSLAETFGAARIGDCAYEIEPLTARIGFGRLHAGVMSAAAEAAATDAVRAETGPGVPIRSARLDAELLTGGKVGPFLVRPDVLACDGGTATCLVEVVDRAADTLIALLLVGLNVGAVS